MRKLPPLNAVRTFEAAARHVSFTKAAEELHVTHGAVSRQVALLEDWFGVKLFRRAPSQLSLTDAGQHYYVEVTAILDRLALASMDIKEDVAPTVLRINAPPTFTMRWLIGRMATFQRKRPDIELRLTTALGPVNANEAGFDVAIRGEQGAINGWSSTHFMTELIAPVCHVDLLQRGELGRVSDLQRHTLITYLTEPYDWRQWFASAGGEMQAEQVVLRFEQMYFALQATQERLGVGLFPLFLIIDELRAGKLCLPFGALGLRKRSYSALFRQENRDWPAIKDFCGWLGDAGHETEQATRAWADTMGWKY
ncbi:LysR substrate-binding domain-containing protein [Bradyrhizobium prioriisuperbiae]|uniref:LysR substrate-binding domain-containing protein n=1 Tax=Bradyrhizobium prioriisuperbiae TaxID=2854389 RepID=UPI0028EA9262|nr:LysR substrate-binding domain-containing protein [Bradyrhizobium prioritasuperba]